MQTTRKKGLTVKDLVMGLAADLVADIRHYRSKLVNSLSTSSCPWAAAISAFVGLPDAAEVV